MKLLYILFLIPAMNCFGLNKLKVETILTKYISACKQTEKGAYVRYRQRVPTIDILEPKINIVHQIGNKLKYQLHGNIRSSGLHIHKVKRIRTVEDIIGDTLILKHYTQIIHIPGKEGSNVMGYNYTKEERLKISKGIKVIKIELHEERLKANNQQSAKLVSEAKITL